MKRRPPPSLDLLKATYHYNPSSGDFTFKIDIGTRGRIGKVAGAKRVDGYVGIALGGKIYLAHHLAWFYYYEEWPDRVDHKDRVKSHNEITNLRKATAPQNSVNSGGWASNKRKNKFPKGVYLDLSKSKRYIAAIRINGKLNYLGYYKTIDEAAESYRNASLKYHGEFSPFWSNRDVET